MRAIRRSLPEVKLPSLGLASRSFASEITSARDRGAFWALLISLEREAFRYRISAKCHEPRAILLSGPADQVRDKLILSRMRFKRRRPHIRCRGQIAESAVNLSDQLCLLPLPSSTLRPMYSRSTRYHSRRAAVWYRMKSSRRLVAAAGSWPVWLDRC
jgi:hypothetical protein